MSDSWVATITVLAFIGGCVLGAMLPATLGNDHYLVRPGTLGWGAIYVITWLTLVAIDRRLTGRR